MTVPASVEGLKWDSDNLCSRVVMTLHLAREHRELAPAAGALLEATMAYAEKVDEYTISFLP